MAGSFDPEGVLPYVLHRAAEATSLGVRRKYRAGYGMLHTELRVRFQLGRHGAMKAKAVCDLAGLPKTRVSRAVAALEANGYLGWKTQGSDRRPEALALTRRGESWRRRGRRCHRQLCRDAAADLR